MRDHRDLAVAAYEAIRAWRLGQVGAMASAYPEPSECLVQLMLAVDNEVGVYREELRERERQEAKARARAGR